MKYYEPTLEMRGYYRMLMSAEHIKRDKQEWRMVYCQDGRMFYWGFDKRDMCKFEFNNYKRNREVSSQSLDRAVETVRRNGKELGYWFEYVIPLEYVR